MAAIESLQPVAHSSEDRIAETPPFSNEPAIGNLDNTMNGKQKKCFKH